MLDALSRLLTETSECCTFHDVITRQSTEEEMISEGAENAEDETIHLEDMNLSQRQAVKSCDYPLSLIWGPPGNYNIRDCTHSSVDFYRYRKDDSCCPNSSPLVVESG